MTMLVLAEQRPPDIPQLEENLGEDLPADMGLFSSKASLHDEHFEKVNCGFRAEGNKSVVTYQFPRGASGHNFGFVSTGSGHEGRYRAEVDGRIVGNNSRPIPNNVYQNIGGVSQGVSGSSYRVQFNSGGQDLSSFF